MWHLSVRPYFDGDAWDVNRSGIFPEFHPARLPSYPYLKREPGSEITQVTCATLPEVGMSVDGAPWIWPRIYLVHR